MCLGAAAGGQTWLDGEDDASAAAAIERARSKAVVVMPQVEEYLAVYRGLLERGLNRIVTVCSSLEATGTWSVIEQAVARLSGEGGDVPELQVRTVDAGVTSVGMGMIVERLAWAREEGMGFEEAASAARELAQSVRLLFIPSTGAPFVQRAHSRKRNGLLARASSLTLRVVGERSLYLLTRGEYTALARSTNPRSLYERALRAMEAVASKEGELVCACAAGPGFKSVEAVEDRLQGLDCTCACLGCGVAPPSILANVGTKYLGVAFVPKDVYLRAGAQQFLPDPIL